MYPLPAHTVDLVLRYIAPLTDSLPPHLISTPLHQRHLFLQISPSSAAEYLCWPSLDVAKTIDLLDHLHPVSQQTSYPTRYTSDPESTFAHVQISSSPEGLCMVFHWDAVHGWRYHDLRIMPFPSPSFATPQESLAGDSTCGAGPPRPPFLDSVAEAGHNNSGDDDSYWDAYDAAGHDPASPLPLSSGPRPDAVEAEDAYWAQYASVQGSADSTIPSPLPINRKPQLVDPSDNESVFPIPLHDDPIIDVPISTIHSRPLTSRVGPPSPNTLAHLLSTISPRKDTYFPILDDPYSVQSPSTYSADPSSEQTTADSELVTPPMPDGYLDKSVVSPDTAEVNGVPLSKCYPRLLDEAEDRALTDSIKGLYYLWKAGRKGDGEKDRSGFLRIVQAAITCD